MQKLVAMLVHLFLELVFKIFVPNKSKHFVAVTIL